MGVSAAGPGPAAFLLLRKGPMTKAKAGALLAFFAEVERRENEMKAAEAQPAPWERAPRPIVVDLMALTHAARKARA